MLQSSTFDDIYKSSIQGMLYEIILNPLNVFSYFMRSRRMRRLSHTKQEETTVSPSPTHLFVCTDKHTAEGKLSGRIRQIKSSAHASGLTFFRNTKSE